MCYMKEVLKQNKIVTVVYIVIGICNAFLTNYKADYFQKVADGLVGGTIALKSIIIYGIILIVSYSMNYLDEYPAKKLEHGIFLDFKLMDLRKISRIDYQEYQKLGTGKLVQRIESGAQAGKNLIYGFWLCLIRQLIPTILFSIYFIRRINRVITYALLGGYVIVFIVTNMLLRGLYQIKEKILTGEEQMNHYLVRGFMEMTVFRMERRFPEEIRKARRTGNEIVRSKVKMNMIHEAFFTIFALLVALLDIGILIYAFTSGTVSIGSVTALISLIDNAYTPIAVFNVLYVQYKLDKTAYRKLEDFLKAKEDKQLTEGRRIETLKGNIEIKNISFRYGDRKIFNHLYLDIKSGEKVAFVGESGCGKSTLIKLIAGLIKYDEGSIRIGGQELKELCLEDLYAHMGYLPQDTPVFDGTLRENIVFDKEISEDALLKVLDKVRLLPLFDTLKEGFNTEIGERGAVLSGGERQRLSLARLWFERKEVILLDEAASAMDNLTEEAVMNEVIHVLEGRTVIAVTHRLSSAADFDRIVVFQHGKIVGDGTFEELLHHNPYFTDLYLKSDTQSAY